MPVGRSAVKSAAESRIFIACSKSIAAAFFHVRRTAQKYPLKQEERAINGRLTANMRMLFIVRVSASRSLPMVSAPKNSVKNASVPKNAAYASARAISFFGERFFASASATVRVTPRLMPDVARVTEKAYTLVISV